MGTHIFPGRGPCHQVPLPVFERHTGVRSLTIGQLYGLISSCPYCMWLRRYGYSFSWSSSTGTPISTQTPLASSEVEGRWQWPSLACHSFIGTACAFGLTWRPLTGSLFLSSFWCRLKPGPSGERGRKSGLLQDMLVAGLGPTSVRVDGRVQAWTRLALDSFKGSNPVWKATGHNEPVDGRVQTTYKMSTETSVRRSVTFNPQGWETVFGRYPCIVGSGRK